MTVETCPHYLTFAAEEYPRRRDAFKCAPPIREHSTAKRCGRDLQTGQIDFIGTDYSPAPAALKCVADGDFVRAWGGIASLQLGLAAVWTGMSTRNLSMDFIARWLAAGPARLAARE